MDGGLTNEYVVVLVLLYIQYSMLFLHVFCVQVLL